MRLSPCVGTRKQEVAASGAPVLLIRTGEEGFECRDDGRVKLGLDGLGESESRHSAWHRVAVWSMRGHGVVGVGHGDDTGEQRDVGAAQPIGVAVPVDAFVVMADDPSNFRVVVNLREDSLADSAVLLHATPFIKCQCTRFFEKAHREPDLPNIVHQTSQMNEPLLLLGKPHPCGDITRVDRYGSGVAGRVLVPSVESGDQG